jgi:hypothetical protein
MQLHLRDAHEHPHLGAPGSRPYGHDVVPWFQTNDFDGAVQRILVHGAHVLEGPRLNPNANPRPIHCSRRGYPR